MSDTYTIVIVKREHPAEGREWIAACEFGREAPDSDMAGGAAYGVAPTADEANAHVLREIGLPTKQPVPATDAEVLRLRMILSNTYCNVCGEYVGELDADEFARKSILDVATERATHEGRGWTAEHDSHHGVMHLLRLASEREDSGADLLANEADTSACRKQLVKAASLLIAAIDLLDTIEAEEHPHG